MRVDLPSGAWVEYRDKLKASDKFAVQDAVVLTFTDGRTQNMGLGIQNKMRNALLRQIITAWSFGVPIPSTPQSNPDLIGEVMDLDDYNKLEEAIQPLLDKINYAPNREGSSSS